MTSEKLFGLTRTTLPQEAHQTAQSSHMLAFHNENIVPDWAMEIGQLPWWIPRSKSFVKKYFDMTHNQGRDCLKAMASWIKEEAVEAGEESAGSLVAITHIYQKHPEKYEIKQQYRAYIGRSKAKQRKVLVRTEMEYQANPITVETILKECYEQEPKSDQSDTKKGTVEFHEPGLKHPKGKNTKEGNVNAGPCSKVPKKSETAVRLMDNDGSSQPTFDGEIPDDSGASTSRDRSPQRCSDNQRGKSPGQ